jgi:hypothetical protein
MLADAIGNYISSLTEREFDAPFIALLRLLGFIDIHFLHGPFEFGKDFIAKRSEDGVQYQYAFQSKAGDIGISEWHQCRGQIDLLRTNALAHPNFDKALNRRAIFVTTGRLIGGAALAAQEYGQHLQSLGELQFLTWDRDTLVEKLATDPRCLQGSSPALLHILGAQHESLNFSALEEYSRSWIHPEFTPLSLRDVLEASVIAQHCRLERRSDLACYVPLMLARSLWATTHGMNPLPDEITSAIATAKNLFRHCALQLWNSCRTQYLDLDTLLRQDGTPGGLVTYPVRCLTIIEILGLLGLLEKPANPNLSAEIADYLAKFVTANVGSSHPISDRWSVSLACCALQLSVNGKVDTLRQYIKSAIKWVADHYDSGNDGLAGPYASPKEETNYLLGSPFEHTNLTRRPESYIATQLLDVCAVLEEGELFDIARNEFLAVDICLPVLEVDDTRAQYSINSEGQRYEPNMPFEDFWHPSGAWKVAPHHHRAPDSFYAERVGEPWDLLAISCVLRDRHFVTNWRKIALQHGMVSGHAASH